MSNLQKHELTDGFRREFTDVLLKTYFENFPDKSGVAFQNTLHDHVEGRYNLFANFVIPWMFDFLDISENQIIEIGSGTGSTTLALAPHVSNISCFEISDASISAARSRLKLSGIDNVEIRSELFSATTLPTEPVDGVMLAAVLEHMTLQECLNTLRLAWKALKPGGWICVVDTPNRLCAVDYHTSNLPFFAALPPALRIKYGVHSKRKAFADFCLNSVNKPGWDLRLTRWGSGISYHEFEIALGANVHQYIIADGFEDKINRRLGTLPADTYLQGVMNQFAPNVHSAFHRRTLYLIIRKPATSNMNG